MGENPIHTLEYVEGVVDAAVMAQPTWAGLGHEGPSAVLLKAADAVEQSQATAGRLLVAASRASFLGYIPTRPQLTDQKPRNQGQASVATGSKLRSSRGSISRRALPAKEFITSPIPNAANF